MVLGWCIVVAITVMYGHHRLALLLLLLIAAILFTIHNVICVAAARLLGLREVLEIGLWLGPAVAWCRVKGVLIRINLLPVASYVRFPNTKRGGAPEGFDLLAPWRKAVLVIIAPLCFTIVGWCICGAYGLYDAPVRAIHWVSSHQASSLQPWKTLLAAFLESIPSPTGAIRAFGILMLANGVVNLLPFPITSGGMAVFYLLEPLLGKKSSEYLLRLLGVVGAIMLLTMLITGITVFSMVVFGTA